MQPPLTTRQRLAAAVLVLLVLLAVAAAWRVRRAGGAVAAGTPPTARQTAPLRHPNGDPDRPTAAPAGKWRVARSEAGAAGEENPTRELQAVPYLRGYRPARARPLISRHDPARAWQGVNLYVSGHAAEAILVDMEGRELHRWAYPLRRLWPDLFAGEGARTAVQLEYWRRAELLPDGGLLAIFEGHGVVRLDRDSRLLWAYRGGAHHDLFTRPDGSIWVLDRRPRVVPALGKRGAVLEDLVTVLSPQGEVRKQISIIEAIARSPYAALLADLPADADVLHTNTLEWLAATPAAAGVPALRAGNLLLSLHTRDAVAVLDPDREEVVFVLAKLWRRQHQPTLLADGRLLVFDNQAPGGGSRALELEPATQRITWSWPPRPSPDLLWTKTLGSCQRLPNGNTLLTESENGRALEVTREGEVVWELNSPHRAGDRGELVATLFEVVRLPAEAAAAVRRGSDPPPAPAR